MWKDLDNLGIVITKEGKVIDANNKAIFIFGCEKAKELIGKNVIDFVSPDYREEVKHNIKINNENPYEHIALKKDGTAFHVRIHAKTLNNGLRLTSILDMGEGKKKERKKENPNDSIREYYRNIINEDKNRIKSLRDIISIENK